MNITETDRSISKSLSSVNNSQSTNNDKLIESMKTLTSILTDMNSNFEVTAKKLKDFSESLGKAAEKVEETGTKEKKTGLSALLSKISSGFSTTFKSNIKTIKDFKFDGDGFDTLSTKVFIPASKEIFQNDKSTAKVMEWAGGLASATSSFMKGDPIGTVMGVGKVLSSVISTGRQAQKEIDQFRKETEQAIINYSIKVIAATKDIKSANDSIFDADTAHKLAQGMTGFNDAQKMLTDLEGKLGSQTMEIDKKKKKVLGLTTGTKTIWGSVADNYKKILDTNEELIDSEGKLNMSIANSLKDSGKLSTEAATTINNMIAVQTAADEAMKQVHETLSSKAGTLGSDLQTALVSAFRDGTNAAKDFSKSVSEILNGIITDQLFNNIFGDMLKDLEKRMQGSFSQDGDQDLTDDVVWFYTGYQSKTNQYNEALKKVQEELNKVDGLNILGNTKQIDQSSSKGGFATMSQDMAGELNGRFTAVQMHTQSIDDNLKTYMEIQSVNNNTFSEQSNSLLQLCSVNVQSMYHLEDIKKNTNHLAEIKQDLHDIKQNTSRL